MVSSRGSLALKVLTTSSGFALTLFIFLVISSILAFPSTDEHVSAILSDEISFAVRLSIETSVISTLLCIIMAIPAAYALARYDFHGKAAVNAVMNVPLALPPLVAGVGLLIFFGMTPFGKLLSGAGMEFVFTPAGIIVAQFFMNAPFMVRIMRSTIESINPRYEHVAKTLGCDDLQAFWRVTMPMSRNGLLAGAVITWSKGIGEFGAALILAGATRMKTEILPVSVFLNMSCGNLDLAISAASIMIVISLISLLIFEKYGRAGSVY
ncbi:molybdate ABC transporter permease subunit [Methanocella sp. CWC-04]|uniref:Molybdate ABC transporter permease subunit n=1 Tax=Methanooceanicella nereidis TaxID=2052831 RepID=A0AAP2RB34_9EURY|nr:ABC transporter permease [Methanocella sp. CWC-04]MCD1294286.1 molybdate ABC transporter permease subunit [Methanocella sp. CWC-04]